MTPTESSCPRPDVAATGEGRSTVRSRPTVGAVAGIAAAAVGLGAAHLVAGFGRTLRSPVLDVGDQVVDRVPFWLKDLAISWFGTNDKPVLLATIGVVLIAYSAVVGVVAQRRGAVAGDVGIVVFAGLGAASALASRSGAEWSAAIPSLIGGATAAAGLRLLLRSDAGGGPAPVGSAGGLDHPSARRRFIFGVGVVGLSAAVLAATGQRLQGRFDAAAARARRFLPEASVPLDGAPESIQSPAAAAFFTPNDEFYRIDTALTVPQVDVDTWTLTIAGLVEREYELSYDDLINMDLVEADITLTCVSNTVGGYLLGTARWLGVRLDDLLTSVDINPEADQIVGRSVDGYTCGFPRAALDGRDALVAIGMNGELLPLEHGYPARLVVPGIYGYASATKWLERIELRTFADFDHYWVPRGYSALAPIKLQSRIDTPRGLDRIAPGPFVVGGVAWAQTIGISAVEVSVDEAEWVEADLADELNDTTWRQWSLPWMATPGRHTIEVRAIDKEGAIQSEERSEPLPNGATGHHKIVVIVENT